MYLARTLAVAAFGSVLLSAAWAQNADFDSPVVISDPAPVESAKVGDPETRQPLSVAEQHRLTNMDQHHLYEFNNADLAEYLTLRTRSRLNQQSIPLAREDAGIMAQRSLGLGYRKFAVQFDLSEGDCVVFVNRMLAMSVASDWQSYAAIIERIRHKDGVVDYRNRNFSTLGDWLPNNAWLLDDVTPTLGPAGDHPAQTFTYVVRPKVFKTASDGHLVFVGSDYKSPDKQELASTYVPTDRIPEVLPDLKSGDVILVLRSSAGGHLGCDHLGMVLRGPGGPMDVNIVHCAPPRAVQEPLTEFLTRFNWVRGLKFLRLKDNARQITAQEVARMSALAAGSIVTPAAQDADVTARRAKRGVGPAPRLSAIQVPNN